MNSKKYIVVTGGAGFIGSNMIKVLLKKTKFRIISIDNYQSGDKKNHIKNTRVKYIKSDTSQINIKLKKIKRQINAIFHFGEFARIFQSFKKFKDCYQSNLIGTLEVFKFCLNNKIKLIYSATSASLGNMGKDKNLSPYAFSKSHNLELLENLKKWFNLKYEIIYFYNVYGPNQIRNGSMATVIGIFERLYKEKKSITVVRPGTQTRRFTHIDDTINICYEAWRKNKCKHYAIMSKKSYKIVEVARLFSKNIKFLKPRQGERYSSALTKMNLNNDIRVKYGSSKLIDYINDFKSKLVNN